MPKICHKCSTANTDDARFCIKCGTMLERACPKCGYVNSADSSFCIMCGVTLKSTVPSTPQKEKKGGIGIAKHTIVILTITLAVIACVTGAIIITKSNIFQPNTPHEKHNSSKGLKAHSANTTKNSVSDTDGNTYKTIKIGKQTWIAENIRATHDRDGNEIKSGSCASSSIPYRYAPKGEESNITQYGYLYNWEAALKVCPKGWHLPSSKEIKELVEYCANNYPSGKERTNNAKALCSTTGWMGAGDWAGSHAIGNNISSNNKSGFSAMPAGFYSNGHRSFGSTAVIWSSTQSDEGSIFNLYLGCSNANAEIGHDNPENGFSVRCIRD